LFFFFFFCRNEKRYSHENDISDYFSNTLSSSKKYYISLFQNVSRGSVQEEKPPRAPTVPFPEAMEEQS